MGGNFLSLTFFIALPKAPAGKLFQLLLLLVYKCAYPNTNTAMHSYRHRQMHAITANPNHAQYAEIPALTYTQYFSLIYVPTDTEKTMQTLVYKEAC